MVVILMKQSESFNHNVNDIENPYYLHSDLQCLGSVDSLFLLLKVFD